MNKKKILLSTAIATTMLVSGMTMPIALAANTEVKTDNYEISSTFQTSYLDKGNSIAIIFKGSKTNNVLTESSIKSVINKKFGDVAIESITVQKDNGVGTGTVVTLANGKSFTIVEYGDVNGDGKIALSDAAMVADAAWNDLTLNAVAQKAANVNNDGKIAFSDAAIIADTAWGDYELKSEILPEDEIDVIDVASEVKDAIDEVNAEISDICTVSFDEESNTVTFEINDENKKIGDLYNSKSIRALAKSLFNGDIAEQVNTISVSFAGDEDALITFNGGASIDEIFASAKQKINNKLKALGKTTDDVKAQKLGTVVGTALSVKVDLTGESAFFTDAGTEVIYTVLFK